MKSPSAAPRRRMVEHARTLLFPRESATFGVARPVRFQIQLRHRNVYPGSDYMIRSVLAVAALIAVLSVSAADVRAQVVADSVSDFSGTQGANGWYYGYYRRSGDSGGYNANTDFRQFTTHRPGDGSGNPGSWVLDTS